MVCEGGVPYLSLVPQTIELAFSMRENHLYNDEKCMDNIASYIAM